MLATAPADGMQPFPAGFRITGDSDRRGGHPCPRRRPRTGGDPAPRLWRDRRHVGAAGRRPGARPHASSCPTCAAWASPPSPTGGYDKKTQGAGHGAGVLDALDIERADLVTHDIGNMVGYAFAAAVSDRVDALRPDGRAAARHRPVGRDPEEPAALAFPLRRARHGAPGRRARAHLPRSVLERVLGRPAPLQRGRRASTTPASMPSPARCMPASPSSPPSTRTPATTRPSSPQGKLTMPVLAIGGEKSFGPTMAVVMRVRRDRRAGSGDSRFRATG